MHNIDIDWSIFYLKEVVVVDVSFKFIHYKAEDDNYVNLLLEYLDVFYLKNKTITAMRAVEARIISTFSSVSESNG